MAPQAPVVVKRLDARVVLVVGDFLGSGLAEGLTTAFSENPGIRIVDRTSGSSGFVRDDFYNWPEKIIELIDTEKPAAIVVMLGTNDRQEMLVGEVEETVRSENWTKEYGARTQALAKAIAEKKVPFLWVGVPAFKSSKMLLDMLAFNDIYRAAASSVGAEFVDIWDGFVDENGAYMSNGPDINGQPARLRAADGINLARPGKRKVAFYAEKPLYKLLGETPPTAVPGSSAPTAQSPSSAVSSMAAIAAPAQDMDVVVDSLDDMGPIDPGRPVALRSPALDGGTELLGEVAEPRRGARTPGEKLAIEGIAPPSLPGRADDFSWPQGAATAMASASAVFNATSAKGIVPAVLPEPVEIIPAPRIAPPTTVPVPALPAPVATIVPTTLQDPVMDSLPSRAVPTEVVLAPVIPASVETTKAKGLVSEELVGGPRDLPPPVVAPRSGVKLPKSLGPEAGPAPTLLPQRADDLLVRQAAPSEVPSMPSALSPAEAEVFAAKGAASEVLPSATGYLSPARIVPRRVTRQPVSSGPAAEPVPTTLQDQPDAFSPQQIAPAAAPPDAGRNDAGRQECPPCDAARRRR